MVYVCSPMGKTRFDRLTLALTKTTIIMLLGGSFSQARVLGMEAGETKSTQTNKREPAVERTSTKEVSVCSNELPFYWNGIAYTAAGNYAVQIADQGVTSLVTLKLTIIQGTKWYPDTDGDGYGNGNNPVHFCHVPSGYVTNGLDCDDSDPTILRPLEYFVDEDGDGFGSETSVSLCSSVAPQGFSSLSTDCDDRNASLNPRSASQCRGIKNELNSASISVYPNPGKGMFALSFSQLNGEVNFEVFNAQGVLILESKTDALQTINLDLVSHPAGIYIFKCSADGFERNLRLVKQ